MSIRSEKVQTCDQCKKEVRYNPEGGGYYGGHPLHGWLHVAEHGGSTTLDALRKKLVHDFCSASCLKGFLHNATGLTTPKENL